MANDHGLMKLAPGQRLDYVSRPEHTPGAPYETHPDGPGLVPFRTERTQRLCTVLTRKAVDTASMDLVEVALEDLVAKCEHDGLEPLAYGVDVDIRQYVVVASVWAVRK